MIRDKIQPFVKDKMRDFLGEVDEDLADFVLENIRDKKAPEELVDGLEPVRYRAAPPILVPQAELYSGPRRRSIVVRRPALAIAGFRKRRIRRRSRDRSNGHMRSATGRMMQEVCQSVDACACGILSRQKPQEVRHRGEGALKYPSVFSRLGIP